MSVNAVLAQRLEEMARMLELLGEDSFRASAHARAARLVVDLPVDAADLARDRAKLMSHEGIGPKLADKIIEFCTTGAIKEHEALRAKVPPGLLDLLRVPGLGPKTIRALWQDRGVTDLPSLRRIIEDGSILTMPRMGAKSVENLKKAMAFAEMSGQRLQLGAAMIIAEAFVERLKGVKGVKRVDYAGSLRRGRDTVGDIDILVATTDPAAASEAFLAMPGVVQVLVAGETKSSVRVAIGADSSRFAEDDEKERAAAAKAGSAVAAPPQPSPPVSNGPAIQVDLRVVPLASYGAAMMYFTGSKEHNVRLRERALRMKLTLNEYGLFPLDDDPSPPQSRGVKAVASKTEEEVYAKLGLPWVPPEAREDRGEFEPGGVPKLIEAADIKAELHSHTTASDGRMSIEELIEQAKRRGFHTLAITDHSASAVLANGLSEDRLLAHVDAVRSAAAKVKGITVLAGSEVDILVDGRLDYRDEVLRKLDVVVASPHVSLSQDPAIATARLVAAASHPLVHIVGHPTGREIGRRPGLDLDLARVVAAAVKHGTALEVNSHWMRLDLRDTHVRTAIEGGAMIAIDCDVHWPEDFDNLRFGVTTARRGGLTAERCINTWPAKRLHEWLRAKRRGSPESALRA